MRLLFSILFSIFYIHSDATIYYVANEGSDSNDGLSPATAWATIAKVNATSFSAGDQVLFKAGGAWNERLNVPSGGSVGNVITFSSYGTGVKPIITGFQTQTGFTNVGNVWTVTATNSVKQLNTVYINNAIRAKARTPNSGYNTMSSFSNSNTTVNTSLTGTPSYVGYEIAVRTAHWIIDVTKITNQSTGILTVSPAMTYAPQSGLGGNGWFFQNNIDDLDVQNEWCYDSVSKVLKIYSTTTPVVKISTLDTLVYVHNKDYVTFNGIAFEGANKAAFQMDTANHITITNCTFDNNGALGISAIKSNYASITKDSIQNSLSGAIYMRQVDPYTPLINTCDNATVDSCYFKNTGIYAGMGMNSNGRYVGCFIIGNNQTITNNQMDSSGYIGFQFNGQNTLVKNNYVSNFCFVKDDGGGVYTVAGAYLPSSINTGAIIRKNVIVNGVGASAGTNTISYAPGVYLDDSVKYVRIDSNTIYNTNNAGLFCTTNIGLDTFYANTVVDSIGDCFEITTASTTMNLKQNIFYQYSSSNFIIYGQTSYGFTDSNYYSRPLNESNSFKLTSTTYGLAGWKTVISGDSHSVGKPTSTSATPLFYYNPTGHDSTFYFTGSYYDSKSNLIIGEVTLQPFTSIILYQSTLQINQMRNYFKRKLRSI